MTPKKQPSSADEARRQAKMLMWFVVCMVAAAAAVVIGFNIAGRTLFDPTIYPRNPSAPAQQSDAVTPKTPVPAPAHNSDGREPTQPESATPKAGSSAG